MSLTSNARNLRKNQTDAERLLWRHLRDRQLCGQKFRRQFPVEPFIVDFVCLEVKLIVELDGGQHAEQLEYDQCRTEQLQKRGFKIIRFWNNEVLQNTTGVLEAIRMAILKTEY
ncbi:endonuclease domain-containing protein [Methylomonas rapida]|uniref:Endonuclease domain-containing protein n=1 Tax=Methylomonas rapida TaxID=2963939 RepID=A0ABY7GJ00_9GAMM|nr:endonuclease domain-containing protein [Methylomonas rapida]WAR44706.1 endonuclease domain-containing protein [Methylomonas rapida]